MRILAGSSGYSYKPWKGPFYPDDMANGDMLSYYGARLPTVEINNTFYRLPKSEVVANWGEQVPAGFRFTLKASRRITHLKRLNEVEEPLGYFVKNAAVLGDKLGSLLFQLPPKLGKNMERLERFLAALPEGPRVAMEFRNETWFDDEVYEALRGRNVALVVMDAGGEDAATPMVATADWGYLRLRGPDYDDAMLGAWLSRIGDQGWSDALVYFKHEDKGAAPRLALRLLELAAVG